MGFFSSWFETVQPAIVRDYAEDILFEATRLTPMESAAFLVDPLQMLIYVKRTDTVESNAGTFTSYREAYLAVGELLLYGTVPVHILSKHRKFLICAAPDTWSNHWRVRRIYRGRLKPYVKSRS